MLTLPTKTGSRSKGFLHDRGGINEDFDLAAEALDHPAPHALQPLLDDVVVVLVLRIDADRRAVWLPDHHHRVMSRRIGLGQHDHRPRLRPQFGGVAAPVHPLTHPRHVAMPPLGHKLLQPLGDFRHRIRSTHARHGKALGLRLRDNLVFLVRNILGGRAGFTRIGGQTAPLRRAAAQKSRSA